MYILTADTIEEDAAPALPAPLTPLRKTQPAKGKGRCQLMRGDAISIPRPYEGRG